MNDKYLITSILLSFLFISACSSSWQEVSFSEDDLVADEGIELEDQLIVNENGDVIDEPSILDEAAEDDEDSLELDLLSDESMINESSDSLDEEGGLVDELISEVGYDDEPVEELKSDFIYSESMPDDNVDIMTEEQEIVSDDSMLMTDLEEVETAPAEYRFDISSNAMKAKDFFLSLVSGTQMNVLVDPKVKGRVSIKLQDVTIEEALIAVRDLYGYQFSKTSYGYLIQPNELETKVLHFNYVGMSRNGGSTITVESGGHLSDTSSSSDTTSEDSTTDGYSSGGVSSHVSTYYKADFWGNLSESLQQIVGDGDGRKIIVNPLSGVIVVTAMANEITSVEDYLKRAEESLTKQVVIEAKILEVELSKGFETGINWSAVGSSSSSFKSTVSSLTGDSLSASNELGGGVFGINFKLNDVRGVIQMLESQGNVNVLSNPKISTLNNQKAVIKVGTDEYFAIGFSATTTTSSSSTAATTLPQVELESFFSGVALDVTPTIDGDEIILHIHPTISDVVNQEKNFLVYDDNVTIPLAKSTVRESDSIVRAKSGTVVVLGGLLQSKKVNTRSGIPFLGKIPIIKWFFAQTREQIVKSELVILLQPTISDAIDGGAGSRFNLAEGD